MKRRCSTPTSVTPLATTRGPSPIHRTGFYSVDYHLTPLESIAAKTKVMTDEFLADNGHDVTDKFLLYLRPLLGSGMPEISAAAQAGCQDLAFGVEIREHAAYENAEATAAPRLDLETCRRHCRRARIVHPLLQRIEVPRLLVRGIAEAQQFELALSLARGEHVAPNAAEAVAAPGGARCTTGGLWLSIGDHRLAIADIDDAGVQRFWREVLANAAEREVVEPVWRDRPSIDSESACIEHAFSSSWSRCCSSDISCAGRKEVAGASHRRSVLPSASRRMARARSAMSPLLNPEVRFLHYGRPLGRRSCR